MGIAHGAQGCLILYVYDVINYCTKRWYICVHYMKCVKERVGIVYYIVYGWC